MNNGSSTAGQLSTYCTTAAELYQRYELLPDSNCIRILDILPFSSTNTDRLGAPIDCNLRVVNLDDRPSFTALSYVWGIGSKSSQKFITCDGVELPVTNNCYSALQHLRMKSQMLSIWVDAICINQEDDNEKTRQIPLMGEIYTHASSVYVWLGEETEKSRRAMKFLGFTRLHRYFDGSGNNTWRRSLAVAWLQFCSPWSFGEKLFPMHANKRPLAHRFATWAAVDDIEDVLTRPWIQRVWTYQEILFASKPVLVCGSSRLPWKTFERSLIVSSCQRPLREMMKPWLSIAMGRDRFDPMKSSDSHFTPSAYESRCNLVGSVTRSTYWIWLLVCGYAVFIMLLSFAQGQVRQTRLGFGVSIVGICTPIMVLLIHFLAGRSTVRMSTKTAQATVSTTDKILDGLCSRRATEPRDMAIGMWPMLNKLGHAGIPVPSKLLATDEVYHIFTRHWIQATKSLDILLVAATKHISGQPSWVPDFAGLGQRHGSRSMDLCYDQVDQVRYKDAERYGDRVGNIMQNVWGINSQPLFWFDPNNLVLIVKGHHIATLTHSFCPRHATEASDDTESTDGTHLEDLALIPFLGSIISTWSPSISPAKQGKYALKALRALAPDYDDITSDMTVWLVFCAGYQHRNPDEVRRHLESERKLRKDHIRTCQKLASQVGSVFTAKPDSATCENDVFIGRCSNSARPGDFIICVRGLSQLLLVRPSDGGTTNTVRIVGLVVLSGWQHLRCKKGAWGKSSTYNIQ